MVASAILVAVLTVILLTGAAVPGEAGLHGKPTDTHWWLAPLLADHAMRGVVKVITATSLVITRDAKKAGQVTFVLSPSTQREGTIEIGTTVDVRYRMQGQTRVATAIKASTIPRH